MNLTQVTPNRDSLNLQEDSPFVMFGPHVEEKYPTTPFYITLLMHDLMLHDCMLDSSASNNLMPLSVIKQLGVHITKPYKYLY